MFVGVDSMLNNISFFNSHSWKCLK